MTADEEVICRDISGIRRRVRLADRADFSSLGSMLRQRLVTGPNDVPFLRKSVPVDAGRRNPRLYDLLDNEIRIVAHLTRVFGGRYGEAPLLAGYNVDVEEPFVLLRAYAGQPAPEAVRGLDQDGKRRFQIGLLRALRLIGEAGVVHGALSLDVLRWTGSVVQLVDFESAQLAGESRHPAAGPRQPPERLHGTGRADPRDDIFSAGVIIRELVIGPQAIAAPADQSADPDRLRQHLQDVFRPVDQRPSATDLLQRMRAEGPPLSPADPLHSLAHGYHMFDEACRRKGAAPPGVPAAGDARTGGRRGWRRLLSAGLFGVAIMLAGPRW